MTKPTLTEAQAFAEQMLAQHFPGYRSPLLGQMFSIVGKLFTGKYPGYQACDCAFHDLTHTLEAAQALSRLLDGHIRSGASPILTARHFELAIAGILLHDSGYLKETGDSEGTGAKFTPVHVGRSAAFAAKCLPPFGVTPDEVRMVQNAIHSTGDDVKMDRLSFRDEHERFLGNALGTADILGQMATPDYPERLPGLYREFAEAAAGDNQQGKVPAYQDVRDLLRRTRSFYTHHVRQMLDQEWGGVYRAYNYHFPEKAENYFTAIEANLDRIDRMVA